MEYREIASELKKIARQMTELADKLIELEATSTKTVAPQIIISEENKLTNKLTLTVAEACEALSMSKTNMYQLIHRDDFPCVMIGRKALIPRDKLIEWLNDHCGKRYNL